MIHPIIAEYLQTQRFNRSFDYAHMPKLGAGLCRWCGTPVGGRRRSWCSDACQSDFLIRWNPSSAAHHVYRRDKGVCAVCGIDTDEIKALKRRICRDLHRSTPINRIIINGYDYADVHAEEKAWGPWARYGTLWEADHIIPVIEGGGCCGLDNLRTLCIMCHKAETKALAARRAQARRTQLEFSEVANG